MNKAAIDEFEELLKVADILLGPEGCPWDREQTVVSIREAVLEEACEVIEAIDEGSNEDLIEELGDLLYIVLFFCKLAQQEKRFELDAPIRSIREKLINRHPHVFGDVKGLDTEGVVQQWEEIKKVEKSHRESVLDGIPVGLPALARAYKVAGKMKCTEEHDLFETEEELGALLWKIVCQARARKLNPEMALRKEMVNQERDFRAQNS